MKKPRILLAEDHALVAQGLVNMLRSRYEVLTVADGSEVLAAVARDQPRLLLLDLSLPGRAGIDLLPELRSNHPGLRILVLSMHVDSHLVEMALRLGANGFVPKNATIDELQTAIAEVLAGRRYVSPTLPKQAHHGSVADPIGFSRLTPRQQEIVRLIATGLTSERIAETLGVSTWTVHYHRKSIRRALGIHNDAEMYRYALLAMSGEESAD